MPTDSKPGGQKPRKRQPTRAPRGRRVLRVEKVPLRVRLTRALESRAFGWGVLHTLIFVAVAMAIGVIAPALRDPAVGRLATETLTARTTVELADRDSTENLRERARQLSPQVYIIEGAVIDDIVSSISSLPTALGGVTEPEGVAPEIRERFELNEAALSALAIEAETPSAWEASIARLRDELTRRPLLEGPVFQRAVQHPAGRVELRSRTTAERVPVGDLLNLADPARVLSAGEDMARRVGVAPALRGVVASRLASLGRSTFRLDEAATAEAAQAAAEAVEEQFQTYPEGAVIYRRGDVITAAQRDLAAAEGRAYADASPLWRRWAERLSIAGGVFAVTFGVVGYIVAYCPRIRRNPSRMAALSMLLLGALAIASFGVVADPGLAPVFLVTPVVFAGGILTIAYDPRTSLAVSTLLAILVTFILGGDIGTLAITEAGLAAVAWRLAEIRDRRALLGMAGWCAAAMGATAVGVGLALLPLSGAALLQIARDTGLLVLAGLGCGAVLLFVLPLVERFFRITTGMTLIELRDPKQPLLREIQQRAPGTYNHSLNVASIAETAADAIGADALLTYVGGLYHDVGKINKPGYFVENQGGGASKHDKLDPAMGSRSPASTACPASCTTSSRATTARPSSSTSTTSRCRRRSTTRAPADRAS